MQLQALYLHNFRNYREAAIEFSPGINHIHGKNAQGKTNLLEAIHFLITGRSFRTRHLKDLVFYGEKEFYLEAHFQKNQVAQTLKVSCDGQQRKIFYNHTLITSLSGLLGIFLGVILSPEDSELVKGEPAVRRQFLDLHIAQTNPLYLFHLSRYQRALKQKNACLRAKSFTSLECWEQELAASGAYMIKERRKAVKELEEEGKPLQSVISTNCDRLKIEYRSATKEIEENQLKDFYLSQFQKQRTKEMELGTCLVGPHKDDLIIFLDSKEARFFASEGQQRSVVASLKLSQWIQIKRVSEEIPLMCIDDLGISLDTSREDHLYAQLKLLGQVFVTSPRDVSIKTQASSIRVEAGAFYAI